MLRPVLKTLRDGDSTAAPGSLPHCLITLVAMNMFSQDCLITEKCISQLQNFYVKRLLSECDIFSENDSLSKTVYLKSQNQLFLIQ